jgi:hypothetical protein
MVLLLTNLGERIQGKKSSEEGLKENQPTLPKQTTQLQSRQQYSAQEKSY